MAGLTGYFCSMTIIILIFVGLVSVAIAAGDSHAVACPVVRIKTCRDLVINRFVAIDADHAFCGMNVILGGKGKAALYQNPAPGRFMTDHAVFYARLSYGKRCLDAPVFSHYYTPLFILEGFAFCKIVVAGMADQAINGVFRLLTNASHVMDMIARMTGVATGEFCLAGFGTLGDLFKVIHRIVAVAH